MGVDCEGWTYNAISFITKTVKISKLGLALVELIQVSFFKCYPRVGFINLKYGGNTLLAGVGHTYFYTKIILNSLHGQVLAQRAELVVNVLVVRFFPVPL